MTSVSFSLRRATGRLAHPWPQHGEMSNAGRRHCGEIPFASPAPAHIRRGEDARSVAALIRRKRWVQFPHPLPIDYSLTHKVMSEDEIKDGEATEAPVEATPEESESEASAEEAVEAPAEEVSSEGSAE